MVQTRKSSALSEINILSAWLDPPDPPEPPEFPKFPEFPEPPPKKTRVSKSGMLDRDFMLVPAQNKVPHSLTLETKI